MQVSIDEIGVTKIRETKFLLGSKISDTGNLIYFAPLDQRKGPEQRWLVIDHDCWESKDGYLAVYTTEEMQHLYRSIKNKEGKPVPTQANEDVGYRFLVRSGKLRMKLKEGCAGCRRFWGADIEAGECSKCHRCLTCCKKESVPFSCASSRASDGKKKK